MRYRFIELHRTVWPVGIQCRVLEVSRSGYYAWRRRPLSAAAQRRAELLGRIRQIHGRPYHNNYGAPRIHRELIAQGCQCNRKTVEKLMCQAGIRAATCRAFRVATTDSRHGLPIAPNRLARQFQPARPHQAWTMDITYVPTDEGWLYLALVEDVLPQDRRLGDFGAHRLPVGHRRSAAGAAAGTATVRSARPLRSRRAIRQRSLPRVAG
jgi:hypothetical protein